MTQDEIIRMALEAGLPTLTEYGYESLQRFAALISAHEREACAKVCDEIERHKWEIFIQGGKLDGLSPRDCAAAIRARSNK